MKNLIYIFLLTASFNLVGQDTLITEKDTIITNTGKIEVDQVEVIKAFEAKLSDAKKISVKPTVKPVIPVEKTYDYDITIVPIQITYPDPIIKPLAMSADQPKNVDHFYTRLGYGDLKSPYADLSYQAVRSDEYDFLISGHFYGADDSEKVKNRKFYESNASIQGGYRIGENNKIKLDLGGNYDQRFLYDTLFALVLEDTTNIERNILNLGTKVSFQNIETTDGGFDYNVYVNGGYTAFDDRIDASEVRFGGGFNLAKAFSPKFSIVLDGDAQTYNLDFSSIENPMQYLLTAKPGIRIRSGSFSLKALADIFVDNNGINPFVEAEAGFSLFDNSMQIYAGVDQRVQDNSLITKYGSNPFVSPLATEQRNTISKQYYGGVRGKVKDFLTYNFGAGYEDITDQRFDRNVIGIFMRQTFDNMTNVFVNANVEFKVNDILTIGGIVNQNFFDPETFENAINMSAYSYNAHTKVSLLNNKLKLRADIDLADQIFWKTVITDELISGNKQLDLSLGLDFFVTKNIALWARANNLLDREYTEYHYYPGFGRNLLGGLLVKF